jgi:creatinine amidohydrolase
LQTHPLLLKLLTPGAISAHLARDPRLIVPVGTTEQHGPHLPLGCDTLIVEHLADDLSAAFQVLRAPTIEYGVNAASRLDFPGAATVRRKTLHRFLNDLVGCWERGGVREFIILTAHGQDPHQEALSSVRTRAARVQTVDIFSMPLEHIASSAGAPIHGGEVDTSLLMFLNQELVAIDQAQDFVPARKDLRRYARGGQRAIPDASPGSLGSPTLSSQETGAALYRAIRDRIAERVFGSRPARGGT